MIHTLAILQIYYLPLTNDEEARASSHRNSSGIGHLMLNQKPPCPRVAQSQLVCQINELAFVDFHVSDLHIDKGTVESAWVKVACMNLQKPSVREDTYAAIAVGMNLE